jgi:SHOCT-like domain
MSQCADVPMRNLFWFIGQLKPMATVEERMQILKMVENKQITAEDAAKLLAALEEKDRRGEPPTPPPSPATQGRWFHVRVTDLKTGKRKVNVNIPLGLVDVGLKMGAKFAPAGLEGLDMNQIMAAIKSGGEGKIVDVEDEEDNEHVEIFIE